MNLDVKRSLKNLQNLMIQISAKIITHLSI